MRSLYPLLLYWSTTGAFQALRPHSRGIPSALNSLQHSPTPGLSLSLTQELTAESKNNTDFTPLATPDHDANNTLIMALDAKLLDDDDDHESDIEKDQKESQEKPFSIFGMTPNAAFALNGVAVLWGTQHAVIKMVVDDADAGPFTLVRFAIGALIASVPLLKASSGIASKEENSMLVTSGDEAKPQQQSGDENSVARWGAEMGLWMFLGFAFQAIGLATTTAQRSGFLLYLNVKFVPFFALVLFGKRISIPTLVSAVTAFAGTALLAYDGTSWSLNTGDLWSIAAAAASAMYILRLDTAAKEVGDQNYMQLNAACLWVVTLLSGLWSVATDEQPRLLPQEVMQIVTGHPLEMIYLSAVTTALANYIQTKSQKEVSAERASVIYALDPVYGALFSNLLLGETLTSLGFVGAGMITVAAATNAFLDLGNTTVTEGKSQHKSQ